MNTFIRLLGRQQDQQQLDQQQQLIQQIHLGQLQQQINQLLLQQQIVGQSLEKPQRLQQEQPTQIFMNLGQQQELRRPTKASCFTLGQPQYFVLQSQDNLANFLNLKLAVEEVQGQSVASSGTIKTNQYCPVCGLMSQSLADFEIHVNGHFSD
jgi:hypothetical protein